MRPLYGTHSAVACCPVLPLSGTLRLRCCLVGPLQANVGGSIPSAPTKDRAVGERASLLRVPMGFATRLLGGLITEW